MARQHIQLSHPFNVVELDMLLPNEILLQIFSFLELKSYIVSHGVCKEWRRLLPFSNLHPVRRRLLNLYHEMISSADLSRDRDAILRDLRHFDRKAYIDALLSQYPVIPEEFKFWILEWPERLAIPWAWPGLPIRYVSPLPEQINWLGYMPESPRLLSIIYEYGTPRAKFIPALLIWRSRETTRWLIFDKDEPELFGIVFEANLLFEQMPWYIPLAADHSEDGDLQNGQDSDSSDVDPLDGYSVYPNWISCTQIGWNCTPTIFGVPDGFDSAPKVDPFTITPQDMPCPPWSQRHLPEYQKMLLTH